MEDISNMQSVYHPRRPYDSPLWRLLNNHYENFERCYEERFERNYGFFRPVIREVVRNYLTCGDLKNGFARVRCGDCCKEYLLAFSCKGRWFCPSCHAKKVVQFGDVLNETILYPVPHRHYVFSIPITILLISPIITHHSFPFPLLWFLILLKKLALFFVFAILGTSWGKAISYHLLINKRVGIIFSYHHNINVIR